MSQNVGEVYAVLGLDKSSFESSLSAADSRFDSFGSSLASKAGTIAKTVGAALIISGAALGTVATVGTKAYMDIESAAADAASKMDLSAIAQQTGTSFNEAFGSVKEHVIDLSRELGQLSTNSFDPNQIAAAMANLAAGGFDVANASASDLAPILSLATAANYDLQSSAEVAMSTMNQYGMTVKDLGHISDVYTLASGKSAAGMSDFKDSMSYVGPAAQNANVSLEESVAMIGKLRDVGIPASTVGTSLRDGMQTLVAPTGAAAKALEAMGLKTSDVSLKNQKFIDVLKKMKDQADKTGEGAAAFIRVFGVTGDTLYNLAGMSDGVKQLTTDLENSNGASEKMAGLMNDTLKGAWNTALGGVTDLGIGIGEKLAPAFESFLKWISSDATPAIAGFIDAIAAGDWDSVGDMIEKGIDFAIKSIGNVGADLWKKISPAISYVGQKFGPSLSKALTFTGGVVGLALVSKGILSIIPAAISAGSTIATNLLGPAMAEEFGELYNIIIKVVGPLAAIGTTAIIVAAGLGTLGYALNPGKFTEFNKVATDAFNGIKTVVSDCWSLIKEGDFSGVGTRLKTAFTDAANYVKEIDWKALGTDIINMVGDGANAVIESALNFGEWIRSHIQAWIDNNGPENLGRDLGDALITGVKYIIDDTSSSSIWDSVTKILGTVEDWLGLGLDIAGGIGSGLYDAFKPYIAKVYNSIITFVRDSHTTLVGWKDQISSTIGHVFDSVVKNIDEIKTFLSTKLTITLDTAWTLWETTVTTIKTCLDEIFKFKLPSLDWSSWGSFENFLVGLQSKVSKIYSSATGGTPSTDQSDNPSSNPTRWTTEGYDSSKVSVSSNSISNSINQAKLNDALSQLYNTKSTSKTSTKLKIMSIGDTVSNPSLINQEQIYSNKLVERSGKELTPGQISSGTWSEGTLNQVKAALEQNSKSTIDNTVAKSESTTTTIEKTGEVIDKSMELIDYYDKWTGTTVKLTQSQIDVMKSYDNSFMVIEDTTKKINNDEKQTQTEIAQSQLSTAKTLSNLQYNTTYALTDSFQTFGGTFENARQSWEATGKQTFQSGIDFSNSIKSSSNEFTTSVNLSSAAVRYGLTDAGQKIAIIGSVAQQQYSAAGKQFIDDAKTGSGFTVSGAKEGNQFIITGAKDSSKITVDSAKEFGGIVTTSANGLASSLSSFNINKVQNLAPDDSKWSHEYFDEITNSSYNTVKKSSELAANTINTASKQYETTIKWTTDSLFSTWNAVLVRTDAANVKSSQNQISSSQSFASNVNSASSSNLATANTINTNSITTSQKNSLINDQMIANAGLKWTTVSDNVKSSLSNTGTNLKTSVVESKDALCAAGDNVEESLGSGADALNSASDNLTTASETLANCSLTIATTASNIIGLANRGGGAVWGGTSISGGGSWIGTGSTAVGGRGYVDWGGTYASILAGNYNSGRIGSFRWGAKGYLADKGAEVVGIGAEGTELVLPSDITETILQLTRQGFKNEGSSQKVFINNPIFGNEQTSEFGLISSSETSKNLIIDVTLEMDGQKIARKVMPYALKDINRSGYKGKH